MNTLIRVNLRTRIGFLLAWIIPLAALLGASPISYKETYPNLDELTILAEALRSNLGTRVLYGVTPNPLNYATWTMWELWTWLVILGGVMAILLAVRLTRAAEEDGITELIRVTGISQRTPLYAALYTLGITCLAFGTVCTLVLYAQSAFLEGFGWLPSLLSGCSFALAIGAFGTFALIAAQIAPTARGARGISLAFLGIMFVIRIIADVFDLGWLRWATPFGWKDIIQPFIENNIWPLFVFAAIIFAFIAPLLIKQRDIQEHWNIPLFHKFFQKIPKPNPRGMSLVQLRLYNQRSPIVWWIIAITSTGTLFLSILGEMNKLLEVSPETAIMLEQMLGSTDISTIYIQMMSTIIAILLCCAVIQLCCATSRDEHKGFLNTVFTTGKSHYVVPVIDWLIACAAGCCAVAISAPLGAWAAYWSVKSVGNAASASPQDVFDSALWSTVDQIPPMIALAGFAILCIGISSRLTWLSWIPLAYSGVITYFGELFQAPDWMMDTSLFAWAAHKNIQQPDWDGALILCAGGVIALVIGAYLFQRRDLRC